MKTMTVRDVLINNLRDQREPHNIAQLVRLSGVARETIVKMQKGDYSKVKFESIQKVFNALGYSIKIAVSKTESM